MTAAKKEVIQLHPTDILQVIAKPQPPEDPVQRTENSSNGLIPVVQRLRGARLRALSDYIEHLPVEESSVIIDSLTTLNDPVLETIIALMLHQRGAELLSSDPTTKDLVPVEPFPSRLDPVGSRLTPFGRFSIVGLENFYDIQIILPTVPVSSHVVVHNTVEIPYGELRVAMAYPDNPVSMLYYDERLNLNRLALIHTLPADQRLLGAEYSQLIAKSLS